MYVYRYIIYRYLVSIGASSGVARVKIIIIIIIICNCRE